MNGTVIPVNIPSSLAERVMNLASGETTAAGAVRTVLQDLVDDYEASEIDDEVVIADPLPVDLQEFLTFAYPLASFGALTASEIVEAWEMRERGEVPA